MSTVSATMRRPVLADLVPGAMARDLALVVALAAITAISAQIRIVLPFTPVPVTGQTFAVLLGAAALGPLRGSVAQVLYVVAGFFLPVYTGGASGWHMLLESTGGYLVGFAVASLVVGALARRGADRRVWSTVLAFVLGSATIYGFGAGWLMIGLHMSAPEAVTNGIVPFLAGDAVKALVAGGLLPATWRLVRRS